MKIKNNYGPKGRKSIPNQLINFGRHLVYSEGTKTEPYYVKNIKEKIAKKYKCKPNNIDLISVNENGKSYNTLSLVKYAFDDVNKRLKNGEYINHVWIMFDKDDFDNFEEAHNQIMNKNNSSKINEDGFKYDEQTEICWHSCWSNSCFEIWLCLYFDYYTSATRYDDYINHLESIKSLKKIKFNYEKDLANIHDQLTKNGGKIENAINFAKKLNKKNGISNPSTGIYLFAEYFLEYFDNN